MQKINGGKKLEQFEIIFYDDDGQTVLDKQVVNKGEKVKYKGKTPSKNPINQIKYTFTGWTNEEKLENVTENIHLIAKYSEETVVSSKDEEEMLKASLENAKNTPLNSTIEAGRKVNEQQKAFEKETRTAEEIVNDILENGKTEIGQEINKNNVER